MNSFYLKYRYTGMKKNIKLKSLERFEDKNIVIEFSLQGDKFGSRLTVKLQAKVPVIIEACSFRFGLNYSCENVVTNGYQSNSESVAASAKTILRPLSIFAKIFSLQHMGYYQTEKFFLNRGILSHTYIHFSEKNDDNIRFYGSVNEKNTFTIFHFDEKNSAMDIYSDCGLRQVDKEFTLMDFIIAQGPMFSVYEHYADYFPKRQLAQSLHSAWTTPRRVNEKDRGIDMDGLEEQIALMKKNAMDIDTVIVGEDESVKLGDFGQGGSKAFPKGMKAAADKIKENGMRPGIWIAPFVAEKKSKLYQQHPDWFLKKWMNFPVTGGYHSGKNSKYYVLDFYKEEVRAYISDMFKTVLYEWGFEVIYVDFLYAAAVEPRINKTRAEIMGDVADFIRKLCRDKIVITASVPMASAFGQYAYCKMTADNAPFWEDNIMKRFGFRERISTESALQTLIARRVMNRRFFDSVSTAYFIGHESTALTLVEKHTILALCSILSSVTLLSDDIKSYDEMEMALLTSTQPNPHIEKVFHEEDDNVHAFTFTERDRQYLVVSNFNNVSKDYTVPPGLYCGKYGALVSEKGVLNLKAHQTQTLVKIDIKNSPQLIYSDTHILPLFGVEEVVFDRDNHARVILKKNVEFAGSLYVLSSAEQFTVNDKPCTLVQNYGAYNVFACRMSGKRIPFETTEIHFADGDKSQTEEKKGLKKKFFNKNEEKSPLNKVDESKKES